MDSEDLKLQIASVQTERDRLTMLLSEYTNDNILIKGERTVKSRKESLWKLAENLTNAFNLTNPLTHELFKNTKEMNEEGYQRLFSCYNNGIERLNKILHQDVYKIEPRNVKGRRARNIVSHKLQDLHIVIEKHNKGKEKEKAKSNNNNNNDKENPITTKRIYRKTSEYEKTILEQLLHFNTFPENEALNVLNQLQDESTGWDLNRIKIYWGNHCHKKKSK